MCILLSNLARFLSHNLASGDYYFPRLFFKWLDFVLLTGETRYPLNIVSSHSPKLFEVSHEVSKPYLCEVRLQVSLPQPATERSFADLCASFDHVSSRLLYNIWENDVFLCKVVCNDLCNALCNTLCNRFCNVLWNPLHTNDRVIEGDIRKPD
jgi:hypothetical protein